MPIIKCHECGKGVSNRARFCPSCGNPMGDRVIELMPHLYAGTENEQARDEIRRYCALLENPLALNQLGEETGRVRVRVWNRAAPEEKKELGGWEEKWSKSFDELREEISQKRISTVTEQKFLNWWILIREKDWLESLRVNDPNFKIPLDLQLGALEEKVAETFHEFLGVFPKK